MQQAASEFKKEYFRPKYWGIWLGLGVLWLIGRLSINARLSVGAWLGRVTHKLAKKRRKLALANLALAFPEKSLEEREKICLEHFESFATGLIELTIVRYGPYPKKISEEIETYDYAEIIGKENLDKAKEQGKGVLILTPHFTHLDMSAMIAAFITDIYPVYRPNNNKFWDYIIATSRTQGITKERPIAKHTGKVISNRSLRGLIKSLREGKALAYLPDQRYTGPGHVTAEFFGVPAPSHTATSKIMKMTGCALVPSFTRRVNGKYQLRFLPQVENFPTGDDYQDALILHKIYEEEIRQNPSQYLWVHNRWHLEWNEEKQDYFPRKLMKTK